MGVCVVGMLWKYEFDLEQRISKAEQSRAEHVGREEEERIPPFLTLQGKKQEMDYLWREHIEGAWL